MLTTPLFKATCPAAGCSFNEASGDQSGAEARLVQHFRETHLQAAVKPISSLEQAP